jgi:hypothetical protein
MKTNHSYVSKRKINQQGQALLFVVVAMTVALAVGIAVSSRTLSSLRRSANTDTNSRVTAAAEGGIEWFLNQPMTTLQLLADANGSNNGAECPAGTSGSPTNSRACVVTYNPRTGDAVTAQAVVEIDEFALNSDGNDHYWFMLDAGNVKEVRLVAPNGTTFYNGNLLLCWQSSDASNNGGIYYQIYNSTAITTKQIISPSSVVGTFDAQGFVVSGGSLRAGYSDCYQINSINNQFGLRIKSMYVPAKIAIYPLSNGFPTQGYRLTSIGQLVNSSNAITSLKELVVYKSFSYMPSIFDYTIYSDEVID